MLINNHVVNISMAVFDDCHKIFIPVEGQEELFVKSMEKKGWIWEEDFYKIEKVDDIMGLYLNSCPLRFIQQIDFSGDEEKYLNIIPQCAFTDENGFFDEVLAKKAFVA